MNLEFFIVIIGILGIFGIIFLIVLIGLRINKKLLAKEVAKSFYLTHGDGAEREILRVIRSTYRPSLKGIPSHEIGILAITLVPKIRGQYLTEVRSEDISVGDGSLTLFEIE